MQEINKNKKPWFKLISTIKNLQLITDAKINQLIF